MAAVSFSGLNGIDFSAIIDATAESTPLTFLKQREMDTTRLSLSSSIATMKSQAQALVVDSLLTNAIASSNAIIGTYSFHVDKPTKAQLTASTTRYERATVIVRDLQSTSDTEKGEESAKELNRLYDYITVRIYEGASKLDYQPVEEVTKLLETLLSRMGRDRPQGTEKRRADGYCDAAGVRRKIRDSGVS